MSIAAQRNASRSLIASIFQVGGFILRDARECTLLRMRPRFLMLRSTATPCVSKHQAVAHAV
jgi:hypothetical protein